MFSQQLAKGDMHTHLLCNGCTYMTLREGGMMDGQRQGEGKGEGGREIHSSAMFITINEMYLAPSPLPPPP
jgi:hypothetical protein